MDFVDRDSLVLERELRISLNGAYKGGRAMVFIRKVCAYLLFYGWSEAKIRKQLGYLFRGALPQCVVDELCVLVCSLDKGRLDLMDTLVTTDNDLALSIQDAVRSRSEEDLRFLKDLKGGFNSIKGTLTPVVIFNCLDRILKRIEAISVANSRIKVVDRRSRTDEAVSILVRCIRDELFSIE